MKKTAVFQIILLIQCAKVLAQQALPPQTFEKLGRLSQSYEAALERATAPLRQTYINELTKLKTECTKAGDLDSALAVDAVIKQVTAANDVKETEQVPRLPSPEVGEKNPTSMNPLTLLPEASKSLRERDIEKIVEGKVWRFNSELLRLDKGGKGARFTGYAGLEKTLVWQVDPNTRLLSVSGVGSRKLIRITGEAGGVGVIPGDSKAGVSIFTQETKPVPELAP